MLRLMRENAGSWIIKILLGLIVIVFIFLGIGPGDTPTENVAATVNDQVISMDEYRQVFNRVRSQYGKNLNEDLIKAFGLREKTLESLIDTTLIIQEAEKMGIEVANEELADMLAEVPVFQTDGHFNKENYDRYLKYTGMQATGFEAQQKKALTEKKFRDLLTEAVQVTEPEIREWFLWNKTETSIDYVLFKPSTYKIEPTEDQLNAYYEENKSKYKTDPKMSVSYLCFDPKNYTEKVNVSDSEIEDRYNNNLSKYETEKTVDARHILVKVDENAGDIAEAEAKTRADELYQKAIAKGQDFSELAKTDSDDSSAANGGSLGTFNRSKMVKPFADKAFSMKAGEISEPVRSRFGWHIIKVEKVNEATKTELAEVKSEIRKAITKEKSEELAYTESDDVFNMIVGGDELADIAAAGNVKLIKTEMFTRAAGPLEVDATARWDFAKAVFDMTHKEISDILEFKGIYYIVQVDEKKGADIQPLDAIKTRLTASLKNDLRDDKAREEASALLSAVKSGEKDLGKEKNIKSTPLFDRNNNGTAMKIDREVVAAAFQLTESAKLPTEPVKGTKGYYVIRLKDQKKPDISGLAKEKDQISNRLLGQKKTAVVNDWLSQAKKESTIERTLRF